MLIDGDVAVDIRPPPKKNQNPNSTCVRYFKQNFWHGSKRKRWLHGWEKLAHLFETGARDSNNADNNNPALILLKKTYGKLGLSDVLFKKKKKKTKQAGSIVVYTALLTSPER